MTARWRPPSRLYAILDVSLTESRSLAPLDILDVWISAGVRLIQIRAKHMGTGALVALADEAVVRCRAAGATLIVNDRADVAVMTGAAGVHVGQNDLSPGDARRVVGDTALVGLSTHSDEQFRAGCKEQVDYLAIGPVFPTHTKDAPDPVVGVEGLKRAAAIAATSGVPVVAIGGMTLSRARAALEAGAEAVAVISDLMTGDVEGRAREYLRALA
jgi:thiamine-phosphate pyrophosphorylase